MTPHRGEHLLEDLVGDLFGRNLGIEHVLLEEGVLSVHVGAVEEPVAVDDVFPVVLPYVMSIVVFLVFYIELVTFNVFADDLASSRQLLARRTIILETQNIVFSLGILFVAFVIGSILDPFLIIKGLI